MKTKNIALNGAYKDCTQDRLLNGKVTILQPKTGYRVAIDPIFLAASINAKPNQQVLDVGFGVGAASICLQQRVNQCFITGIEVDNSLIPLALYNCRTYNNINILHNDIKDLYNTLPNNHYDHVITNPPYFDPKRYRSSPNPLKASSHMYSTVSMKEWVQFCINKLKTNGIFTIIYRPDYFHEIISSFDSKIGKLTVYPIWPRTGQNAVRLIIQAVKGSKSPCKVLPGIVLHDNNGYTAEAEAILKHGGAINF